jgi:hypothetical protein
MAGANPEEDMESGLSKIDKESSLHQAISAF